MSGSSDGQDEVLLRRLIEFELDRVALAAERVELAAARASREAGHDLTFIAGDANDWPWKLYERLGFDPIGEDSAFLRKPAQPRESP